DARSSAFTDNSAQQDGGAIYNRDGSVLTLTSISFTHNVAISDTGGAVLNRGALSVAYSFFGSNHGGPASGTLGRGGGSVASDDSVIGPVGPDGPGGSGGPNSPGWVRAEPGPAPQGVIVLPANRLLVDHSTFAGNSSDYEGGAIDASHATIVASTFSS